MFDPNVAWKQIDTGTKMGVGARNPVGSSEGGSLHFNVLRGSMSKIVIDYSETHDTYTVSFGKINRHGEWRIIFQQSGADAEDLSSLIYDMTHGRFTA